ncbi:hypothetical protein ACTMU2_23305 [Cupriavidus basilensis]
MNRAMVLAGKVEGEEGDSCSAAAQAMTSISSAAHANGASGNACGADLGMFHR